MKIQIHELGALFEEVQNQNILGDGKTFPDCIGKRPLDEINDDFQRQRDSTTFNLKKFVEENFFLPKAFSSNYKSDPDKSPQQHIAALWEVLTRQPDEEGGSLIALPKPYIVPGGRFREIYYWDSYFTMLGLRESGRIDLIQNMVDNFNHLIHTVGYIPNGNRTYFLGRSQPPFFSLMVRLLEKEIGETKGADVLITYLPALEKEYLFWMKGSGQLSAGVDARHRVVRMPGGELLNRYWDENNTPRPEAYKEDVELSHLSKYAPQELYRHLRAAAESGWDFSSRWFKEEKVFASIHTTDIIPVDLNCLLYHLEHTLADAYHHSGDDGKATYFITLAEQRKAAILRYCWNAEEKFFFDYDFVNQKQKRQLTLAAAFPLFFEVASHTQAMAVEAKLMNSFLKHGGLTTTLDFSGQQWDAPNGWAPLQWIAYKGLLNYGFNESAEKVKARWTNVILKVYKNSGKMTEKYDVWNQHGEASGGEYPNQDGFGWTNGVFLAMMAH